jgi:hypothetical protein
MGAGLERFVEQGSVRRSDLDNLHRLLDDPTFFTSSIPSMGIRAQRPAG